MRALPLLLIIFSFSAFSKNKITTNVKLLCKLAHNCETYQAKAKTIKGIIKEYANYVEGEELADENYHNRMTSLPDIEEIEWGRLTMKQALSFVSSHGDEDFAYEGSISKKNLYKINGYILKMIGTGVQFGFTASTGGDVCGAVFPGLLIIDMKLKKVYDVSLFGWPEC